MSEQSAAEQLATNFFKSVVGFPTYAISYTVGLVTAILSDLFMTTFALAGITVGFAFTWPIGLAAFFVLYAVSRVLGNMTNAIGNSGGAIAGSVMQHGHAVRVALDPDRSPDA